MIGSAAIDYEADRPTARSEDKTSLGNHDDIGNLRLR
jgi:hypothetical protein